jgi:SAM-dependent methyltransferase
LTSIESSFSLSRIFKVHSIHAQRHDNICRGIKLPTIEENRKVWNDYQSWKKGGKDWSEDWGNPDNQWWGSIFPRLHSYVPTGKILEIGPGFGRWTRYLKELCNELVVVDLSEICIQECKKRFPSSSKITYYVNDGKTLDMILNESIDLVFSFDSLVHAEDDVIEAYIRQLAKKLKPNGLGFIHHSNIGEYKIYKIIFHGLDRMSMQYYIIQKIFGISPSWRAMSMTAKKFEQFVENAGMQNISQEKINWHNRSHFLIDCISVFTPKGSIWARSNRMLANKGFMAEARYLRKLSELYSYHQPER